MRPFSGSPHRVQFLKLSPYTNPRQGVAQFSGTQQEQSHVLLGRLRRRHHEVRPLGAGPPGRRPSSPPAPPSLTCQASSSCAEQRGHDSYAGHRAQSRRAGTADDCRGPGGNERGS